MNRSQSPAAPSTSTPPAPGDEWRPRATENFWPYRDLSEHPTAEEMAALDPDLYAALFGQQDRPFSFTIVFPRFDGPDYEQALALARKAVEYREVGEGDTFRVRARFLPSDPLTLRDLFSLVSPHEGCDVLVDDRPVPFARELWLPLVWFLLPR